MKHKRKRKEISKMCRAYGVRFRIKKLANGVGGLANLKEELITIEVSQLSRGTDGIMSIVMHEINHILAYRSGKYRAYHTLVLSSKQEWAAYISTALRAERYVDRHAEKMFNRFYSDLEYRHGYRTKKQVAWFNKWLEPYKAYMRSL